MIGSYFRSAVRTLGKHRESSFLHVLGLATGMAAALLILRYVSYELSYLLIREFVLLVVAATLLALPSAYLVLRAWLDNYAFRSALDWTVFAVPTVLVFLVALLTISYHIIKAAGLNPVESLRTE